MARHTVSHAGNLFFGPCYESNANSSLRGVPFTPLVRMDLGTPAAASSTALVNAAAVAAAGALALTLTADAVGMTDAVILDVPRALQYVTSNAGNTTQTVTVSGFDVYKQPMTETITLNGVTAVNGKKAFAYVASISVSAAITGTISVGTSARLGLPYALLDVSQLTAVWGAGATDMDPTKFTVADQNTATSGTGDVRGLYVPTTAPNGSRRYVVTMAYGDVEANTAGQYTQVYGVAQA